MPRGQQRRLQLARRAAVRMLLQQQSQWMTHLQRGMLRLVPLLQQLRSRVRCCKQRCRQQLSENHLRHHWLRQRLQQRRWRRSSLLQLSQRSRRTRCMRQQRRALDRVLLQGSNRMSSRPHRRPRASPHPQRLRNLTAQRSSQRQLRSSQGQQRSTLSQRRSSPAPQCSSQSLLQHLHLHTRLVRQPVSCRRLLPLPQCRHPRATGWPVHGSCWTWGMGPWAAPWRWLPCPLAFGSRRM